MRIFVLGTGGTETPFCRGIAENEHVEDFSITPAEEVQSARFVRATVGKTYPRGNTLTQVRFTVTKEHTDFRTCEEYMLERHASIPKSGDIIFESESAAGRTRYKLSDASLVSHPMRHIGVTSMHTFEILGGDFAKVTS